MKIFQAYPKWLPISHLYTYNFNNDEDLTIHVDVNPTNIRKSSIQSLKVINGYLKDVQNLWWYSCVCIFLEISFCGTIFEWFRGFYVELLPGVKTPIAILGGTIFEWLRVLCWITSRC